MLSGILPSWLRPWWSGPALSATIGLRFFDDAGNETHDPQQQIEIAQRELGLTRYLQIFDESGAIVAESGNRSKQAEQPQPYGQ